MLYHLDIDLFRSIRESFPKINYQTLKMILSISSNYDEKIEFKHVTFDILFILHRRYSFRKSETYLTTKHTEEYNRKQKQVNDK